MSQSIPASQIVDIVPSVLSGGGSGLDLNGVLLTTNFRVPIGSALSFPSANAVSSFFGPASLEAALASNYFLSYTISTKKPGSMLFWQYNPAAVTAILLGASLSGLTLTQLQALSGTVIVTINGVQRTLTQNLGAATSFSNAAQLMNNALSLAGPQTAAFTASIGATCTATSSGTNITISSVTGLISVGDRITGTGISGTVTIVSQTSGSTGGAGVYVTSASTTCTAASVTVTSNVLNVTAVASGAIVFGNQVAGTSVPSGDYVSGFLTGTGGVGTYTLTGGAQVVSESMTSATPVITYDSISGGFNIITPTTGAASTITFASGTIATPLGLTQATGAVLSQGADAATPAASMTALRNVTQNWASYTTAFDPDGGSGSTLKQAFAAWTNTQNNDLAYIAWDTDVAPTLSQRAASSFGWINENVSDNSGTEVIWSPSQGPNLACFVMGYGASLDFTRTNGRTVAAFRQQAGLSPDVISGTIAQNLLANSYNFYGSYSTANQLFNWFQNGSISGQYDWLDSFFNQIWLTNQLQLALMQLLQAANSIPYNASGYALIRAACMDPINAALNYGAIRPGVPLSAEQAAIVNANAGVQIDNILFTQGWYLQVQPATAQVRVARTSPPCTLWYMDGGSVQQITLASIEVQ